MKKGLVISLIYPVVLLISIKSEKLNNYHLPSPLVSLFKSFAHVQLNES